MAFEAGTMEAEDCGRRLQELGIQLRDLRARQVELESAMTTQSEIEITVDRRDPRRDPRDGQERLAGPEESPLQRLIVQIDIDGKVAYPKYRAYSMEPSTNSAESLTGVTRRRLRPSEASLRSTVSRQPRPLGRRRE